eukprot:SAG31_NODE_3737_length_3936_cov_2.743028_2_plen_59_part_00
MSCSPLALLLLLLFYVVLDRGLHSKFPRNIPTVVIFFLCVCHTHATETPALAATKRML